MHRPRLVLVALLALLPAAALAGCLGGGPDGPATPPGAGEAFRHVHGLAVDPQQAGRLYVATHHGLFVGDNGTSWQRVGPADDYMGFIVHPTNASIMWSSGHPQNPTAAYHNLGVRQSRDGGHTWETIALEGVDFHAMAVSPANPDRLWGYVAGGKLHRSDDGGRTWSVIAERPPGIAGLAADPDNADLLYAAGGNAGAYRSLDGGATWASFSRTPMLSIAVDPSNASVLYASTRTSVLKSSDAGVTWGTLPLAAEQEMVGFLAVDPQDPRAVYAATFTGAIHRSLDGGATWTTLRASA